MVLIIYYIVVRGISIGYTIFMSLLQYIMGVGEELEDAPLLKYITPLYTIVVTPLYALA